MLWALAAVTFAGWVFLALQPAPPITVLYAEGFALPEPDERFCSLCWAEGEGAANTLGLYFINGQSYCPFSIVPYEQGRPVRRTYATFGSMGQRECGSVFVYRMLGNALEGELYRGEHPADPGGETAHSRLCPACRELLRGFPSSDMLLVDTARRQVYDPWALGERRLGPYWVVAEPHWRQGVLWLQVTDLSRLPLGEG